MSEAPAAYGTGQPLESQKPVEPATTKEAPLNTPPVVKTDTGDANTGPGSEHPKKD